MGKDLNSGLQRKQGLCVLNVNWELYSISLFVLFLIIPRTNISL